MKKYLIGLVNDFSKKHPKRFKWLSTRLEGIVEPGASDEMLLWKYEHTITMLDRHIKHYQEGHTESIALMNRFRKETGRSSYVIRRSVDKIGHDVDFLVALRSVLESEQVRQQYKGFSKEDVPEKLTPAMKKVRSQVRSGLLIKSKT